MTNIGTKENIYFQARKRTAAWDECFDDRANAALEMGISASRISQIERGKLIPHRDELVIMSQKYRFPRLLCHYCLEQCEVGQNIQKLFKRGILMPNDICGWMEGGRHEK